MTSAQSIGFPLLYHLSSSPFYFEGQLHPNKIPTVPVGGILKPAVKTPSNLVVSDQSVSNTSSAIKLSKLLSATVKPVQATNLNLAPRGYLDPRQQPTRSILLEEKEPKKEETVKRCFSEKIEEENKGFEHFSQFEELHAAETRVFAQLKTVHKASERKEDSLANEERKLKSDLWKDLMDLNSRKRKILSFFVDSENKEGRQQPNSLLRTDSGLANHSASNVPSLSANLPNSNNGGSNNNLSNQNSTGASVSAAVSISISQQPADFAVANRYLMPPPTVAAQNLNKIDNNSTLVVSARLFYHEQEEEMTKTQDGKQEVLQGIKKVSLDKNGRAVFNKLKIMEVSSKHKHQAFCLVFFLEEYTSHGLKKTLAKVKSAPFHVQSRSNKRKREGEDDPMSPLRALLKTSSAALFSSTSANSPAITSSLEKEESDSEGSAEEIEKNDNEVESDQEQEEPEPEDTAVASPSPSEEVGNYIDITDLLVLPQKEAARRLGISESMLCKRFKECTKRKWPYRYLRKIDKVMNLLSLPKMDGAMSKEDREKLEQLKKEREDCLKPVKIRITAHDKLNAFSSSMGILTSSNSSNSSNSNSYNSSGHSSNSNSNGPSTPAPSPSTSPGISTQTGGSLLGSSVLSGSVTSAFSPKEPGKAYGSRQSAQNSSLLCKHETIEDEIPTDVLETLEMLKGTVKEENNAPVTTPSPYSSNSFSLSVPSPTSSFSFAPTITTHTPTPSFSASSSCPSFPCPPSSSSILSSFSSPAFFPASSPSSSAPSSPSNLCISTPPSPSAQTASENPSITNKNIKIESE